MKTHPHLDLAQPVCVAIVDDHDAVRYGVQGACAEAGYQFCGSAGSVSELLEARKPLGCDVVILDLSLADGSQVEMNVKSLIEAGSQVLIYSIADKAALVSAALKAGAAGGGGSVVRSLCITACSIATSRCSPRLPRWPSAKRVGYR